MTDLSRIVMIEKRKTIEAIEELCELFNLSPGYHHISDLIRELERSIKEDEETNKADKASSQKYGF